MSDASVPSGDPETATLLYNVYPVAPGSTRKITGRPGCNHIGTVASPGLGQMVYQFRKLNGTTYTVLIINGLMFTVNWATNTLTSVPLGGGVTIQTTGKVYATQLADKMIVSDGVSKPWSWDGTTFAILTNCPVLFGQPEIYYAKLFGIVAANPVQIVWSEENQPETGYDTQINPITLALYNNQWVLGQTSQDRLYVLKATADALYFARARSWSMITGPAETDFRSTGNREAVSNTVGCTLPSSCIFRNDEIWFQDRDGFFWIIPMGGQPVPISEGYREAIEASDKDPPATTGGRANLCSMVEWPLIPLVMATVAIINPAGGPWRYRILTWNPTTKECQGVWDLPTTVEPTHLGVATDLNELNRVIIVLDENGHVMSLGTPQDGPWQDVIYTGNVAIRHEVKGAELGWSSGQELDFDTLTSLTFGTVMTGATLGYTTPTKTTSVPQALPNQAALALPAEIRRKVGVRNQSRWIQPDIIHTQLNERFTFLGFEVGAYLRENAPRLK